MPAVSQQGVSEGWISRMCTVGMRGAVSGAVCNHGAELGPSVRRSVAAEKDGMSGLSGAAYSGAAHERRRSLDPARERRRSERAVHGGSGWEGASHLAAQVVRCQGRVSYVEACCALGNCWWQRHRRRRNGGGIGAEDRYGSEEPDAHPHPEAEPTLSSRHPESCWSGVVHLEVETAS